MKKHVLILVIAGFAFGINTSYGQATFGIKAGANLANVNFDTGTPITIKPDALIGFYAGATARFDLAPRVAIQPELLLSLQGFKFESGDLFGEELGGDFTSRNLYLNLPIMARFSATDALYLEAGPQVGLLLNADGESQGISAEISDIYNDLDFGLNLGAGYQLPAGLSIEARYNFGLANIASEEQAEQENDDSSATNRVFSLGLGYTF